MASTATDAAGRITLDPQLTKTRAQRIDQEQTTDQWFTELRQ
jgi:hypothetical protein